MCFCTVFSTSHGNQSFSGRSSITTGQDSTFMNLMPEFIMCDATEQSKLIKLDCKPPRVVKGIALVLDNW